MADQRMNLDADALLTTTRSVRRRLDLEQEVPCKLLFEAIEIAIQAPTGGNIEGWTWLVIEDTERKRGIADLYRKFYAGYRAHVVSQPGADAPAFQRMLAGADHLSANLERVPWLVIPCITGPMGRVDEGTGSFVQASTWASIYPAVWSFQLALRERGLASCITTNHLVFEREVAELLGIPFETTNQACLLPVAFSLGTEFKRAARRPAAEVTRVNVW